MRCCRYLTGAIPWPQAMTLSLNHVASSSRLSCRKRVKRCAGVCGKEVETPPCAPHTGPIRPQLPKGLGIAPVGEVFSILSSTIGTQHQEIADRMTSQMKHQSAGLQTRHDIEHSMKRTVSLRLVPACISSTHALPWLLPDARFQ